MATVLWVGESAGGRLLSTALSTGAVPKLRYLLGIVVVVLGAVLKRVIYTGVVRKPARAMAATGGAAGKENDADDEAAVGAQPTKRNSKDLPRGVVRVKKEYQARASWKPIGAIKAKQRHIACFTTIPEAAQAVRDTEALLAAGGNPWADRPVRKRKHKRGEVRVLCGLHTHALT